MSGAGRPRDLRPLLEPRGVAIVGASANPQKIGGRPLAYMRRLGFSGALYPVNPARREVQGLRCYASLSDIGQPVDLAIVATPADAVEAAVAEGLAVGVGAFVVFSSGFAEQDAAGAEAQRRLHAMTAAAGALLLGPNCLGAINSANRLAASFTTALEGNALAPGGFSFVSQSGALGAYWLDMVLRQSLGVGTWITTGNEGGVDLADAIAYLAEDPATRVIGVYLEDVKDGRAFRRAVQRAAETGKPILAMKAGRSAAGAAAAASHTGALAGEDRRYQAFFEQFGIRRVASLGAMLDAARLLLKQPPARGRSVGILSVSGGAGVLLADEVSERGFAVPDFDAATKRRLAAVLPGFAKPANPLDITGNVVGQTGLFGQALSAMTASDDHDVYLLFIGLMHSIAGDLSAALQAAFAGSGKQVAVVWIGAPAEVAAELEAAGIPVFADIPQAAEAVAAAVDCRTAQARVAARPQTEEVELPAAEVPAEALSEARSKVLLAGLCDLPCPNHRLVTGPDEVAAARRALDGPLAVKLQSPDLLHKSERGGVALALETAEAVAGAVARMLDLARAEGLRCDGVLLQEMCRPAQELIVGFKRDRVFGPLLLIGRGGVEVEVRPDVRLAYLPLRAPEIEALLNSLETAALLRGHRGAPAVDLARLAAVLAELGRGFAADPDLLEIEINPLAITADGGFLALDALVMRRAGAA